MSDEPAFGYETVDILPTEITSIKEVQTACIRALKDLARKDDLNVDSLTKWAIETDNRHRAIGFAVWVDPFNVEVDSDERPYLSPVITVTGRTADTEFDFDQASSETQHGLLDGDVGKVSAKGIWTDPDVVI